jgi:hypothetical protein
MANGETGDQGIGDPGTSNRGAAPPARRRRPAAEQYVTQGDELVPVPTYAPHARGYAGEQGSAFQLYRVEDGWVVVRGPSGAGGHGVTTRGEDGLFYNMRSGALHIVDNKALQRSGNVSSATAITRNLLTNLRSARDEVAAMDPRIFNQRNKVLVLLRRTIRALESGEPLPGRVSLIVTNFYGRSTGVTERLRRQGVRFVDVNAPPSPLPGTRRPDVGRFLPSEDVLEDLPIGDRGTQNRIRPPRQPRIVDLPAPSRTGPPAVAQLTSRLRTLMQGIAGGLAKFFHPAVQIPLGALFTIAEGVDAYGKAVGGLSGRGFILRREIALAQQWEKEAYQLLEQYRKFHEDLLEAVTLANLAIPLGDAELRNDMAAWASQLFVELSRHLDEVGQRLPLVSRIEQEAGKKEQAARQLLESREFATLAAMTGRGTSPQTEALAAAQDLSKVRGAMASTYPRLMELARLLREDIAVLEFYV